MQQEKAKAIFLLAGITITAIYETPNRYWPKVYEEERASSPWWLVHTDKGIVLIGWRKRVISIDWSDTKIRGIVTADEVTKDETSVHAWSYAKAVQYLAAWNDLKEPA